MRLALLLAAPLLLAACQGPAAEDGCECDFPDHCEAGLCTSVCSGDDDCGDQMLICGGGACTTRCDGILCNDGFYCESQTGDCIPDPDRACHADADCDDDTLRCDAGICVTRCAGVTCNERADELCNPRSGECVGGRACQETADCQRLGGQQVCEDGLCAGEHMAACNAERPCVTSLDCVGQIGYAFCASPCKEGKECLINERCIGGKGAYADHCVLNLCRPGGGPLDLYQDVGYLAPCDAAGTADGLCFGPLPGGGGDGDYGICYGKGTSPTGGGCSALASHGSKEACVSGFCAGGEAGAGVCLDPCAIFDGKSCPDLLGQSAACVPFLGGLGACLSHGVPGGEAIPEGDACVPPAFAQPCEEDHACLPAATGASCQLLCLVEAEPGAPGACATGTCKTVSEDNERVGTCAP